MLALLLAPASPSPLLAFNRFPPISSPSSIPAADFLRAASRRLISATKTAQSISTMATEEENVGNIKRQLAKIFEVSLRATVPEETDVEPLVAACAGKFGDYQWPS